MFGFVSHQVADVTWHSLGIQQGFLQTMDKVNFHGSFSAAHTVGDPGGDMVNTFEGDTEGVPFSLREWYTYLILYLENMDIQINQ
jgi:glycosylphosphatidylinositol phospholipase D